MISIVRAEAKLSESVRPYAALVQQSYRTKCQGSPQDTHGPAPVNPELGVTFKTSAESNEYKVFVKPSNGVSAGAGMSF